MFLNETPKIRSQGIEGLDELAEQLGLEQRSKSGTDLSLVGVSGKAYSLVDLLQAHVNKMNETT